MPDCISLTIDNIGEMYWLMASCAYKRLYYGQPLPSWHLLLTQDAAVTQTMMQKNISVAGRCQSETEVSELEQRTTGDSLIRQ